ncbi:ABC transporter substrate-binding protein [Modestobacter sp. URMC 112]
MGAPSGHGSSTATVVVDRTGSPRVRPAHGLHGTGRLIDYLRAAARQTPVPPLRFVWLGQDGSRQAAGAGPCRVDIASRRSPMRCVAEITPLDRVDVEELTDRELQVLTLLACGLTNPGIADRLGVTRRTVATHIERVLLKLGVPTRAAAAALAVDRSLLALPLPSGGTEGLAPLALLALEDAVEWTGPALEPAGTSQRRTLARRPLVIGAVYPANPEWSADGLEMERGALLAVEELNRRGGVAGRRVEHVPVRADLTAPGAVAGALRTLVDADVDAVTMGYLLDRDRTGLAAQLEVVSAAGCPVLHHSTSATAAALVADEPDRFGNVFQVCAPESTYGLGFVRCMTQLRDTGAWQPTSRRLLVIDSTVPGLTTYPAQAADAAERHGWQVSVERIDLLRPDWARALQQIQSIEPAAVMLACFVPSQLAHAVRRLSEEPTGALLYALYSPSVSSFLGEAGPAAEGLLWATVTGVYRDRFGREFGERFRARFGREPGMSSSGIHFDMTRLLSSAWSRCQSPRDFREVGAALRGEVHRGVNGAYHLGGAGQTGLAFPDATPDASISQAHLVFQVQDGGHRIIAPSAYADAAFRAPAR